MFNSVFMSAFIKSKVVGKDSFVLNISDGMIARIVANATDKINWLNASKERLLPDYEAKKAFYEEVKREFDELRVQFESIESDIKEQQILISSVKSFRSNPVKDKSVVVLASAVTRKGTKAAKRVMWLQEAEAVLSDSGVFMSPDALFDAVVARPNVKEALRSMKAHIATTRKSTIESFVSHGRITASGAKAWSTNFKPVLVMYKELLGLCDWVDSNHVPKPQYMKAFVYKR